MQVKIFDGTPAVVEQAINKWMADGVGRQIVGEPTSPRASKEGHIALMFLYLSAEEWREQMQKAQDAAQVAALTKRGLVVPN
jgi:hypothetical protein